MLEKVNGASGQEQYAQEAQKSSKTTKKLIVAKALDGQRLSGTRCPGVSVCGCEVVRGAAGPRFLFEPQG